MACLLFNLFCAVHQDVTRFLVSYPKKGDSTNINTILDVSVSKEKAENA